MSNTTYQRKLADPQWQRKRLEILNRDNFTCQRCKDTTKELHVHHKYYLPETEAWEYDDDCYVTLCHECHEFESWYMKTEYPKWGEFWREQGFMAMNFYEMRVALQNHSLTPDTLRQMFLLLGYKNKLLEYDVNLFHIIDDLMDEHFYKKGKTKNL